MAVGMAPAACSAESPPSDGDLIAQLAEADMPPQGSASPISSPYGAYLAGQVAQSDGDLEAAADYILQALTYDPDNPDLLYARLPLAAATGRHAEAVQRSDDRRVGKERVSTFISRGSRSHTNKSITIAHITQT